MRNRSRYWISIGVVFIVATSLLSGCLTVPGQQKAGLGARGDPPPRGCTIFTVSHGDQVFFGGNGDWINFDSNYYWVDPGNAYHYGAIYFGKPDNMQQGFNEKGLAYDSNGLAKAPITTHTGSQPVFGGYGSYPIQILQACATVEEVIAWVQSHQWHEVMHDQLHFADKSGDAVVISAGPDGKVAFTRKPEGDGFLVSTNFNVANPSNGSYPCWRYERAEEMLKAIDGGDELTADGAAAVLDAVHVASPSGFTILSVLGDLPRGLVYVYLFHQFDAPITLDVAEEIARAPDPGPLRDLFPRETLNQVDRAYQRLMARSTRCNAASLMWLGLVAVSLVALFLITRSRRRGFGLGVLVVLALGPVGLLVWLIATRAHRAHALLETAADLPPYVVGIVAELLFAVLVPSISQSTLLQLFGFYGFPFFVGLFLYQAPLLARGAKRDYVRTLWCRLPAVLISTNLTLAGIAVISLPLVQWHIGNCGFGALTALSWWAIVALGALAGGVLLYVYHTWAVRRGFKVWSSLVWDTDEVRGDRALFSSPRWRDLWPWILSSFVVLIAMIVLGIVVSMLVGGAG